MDKSVNKKYDEVLDLINQLPSDQIAKLMAELDKVLGMKKPDDQEGLQAFLSNGPVMSESEFIAFQKNRQKFNEWL